MDSVLPLQLDQINDENEQPAKVSRPRAPIFDAGRLISPQGLPKLRTKLMATKLKGHTRKDLGKVLGIYEIWSHRLWPKSNQRDLLELIAKAGNTPEIRAWRKEVMDQEKYGSISFEDTAVRPDGNDILANDIPELELESEPATRTRVEPREPARPAKVFSLDSDDSDDDIILANNNDLRPEDLDEQEPRQAPADTEVDDQWEIYAQLGF